MLVMLSYLFSKRTFISIGFLTCIMFLVSALVLLLNNVKWKYAMSDRAFIVLLVSLFMVCLGEICSNIFGRYSFKLGRTKSIDIDNYYKSKNYSVSDAFYIASIVVIIITAIMYFRELQLIINQSGFSPILNLSAYRHAKVIEGVSDSVLVSIFKEISYCLCLFYIYIFINGSRNKKYIVPALLYSVIVVISSGRAQFIYIIAAIISFIYFYFLDHEKPSKYIVRKMLRFSILSVVIFLGAFYLLGLLTNKSDLYSSAFENISIYLSSSYLSLDEYLNNHIYNINDFGTHTFFAIINLVRKFGVDLAPSVRNNYLEFLYFPNMGHTTNVYTYIGRLYHDYSYAGTFLISFVLGWVYTRINTRIKEKKYRNNDFAILLYSSYFYPVIYSIFDFKYFDIFSLTGLVHIVVIWFLTNKIIKTQRISLS